MLVSAVCPLGEAGLEACAGLGEGAWFPPADGWSWVLCLWWAGLCQGLCGVGGSGTGQTSSSTSPDGQGCVPVCWLFGLRCLAAAGLGQVLVRKACLQEGSQQGVLPGALPPVSVPAMSRTRPPPRDGLPSQQPGLAQAPVRPLLSLGPGAHETCVCLRKHSFCVPQP